MNAQNHVKDAAMAVSIHVKVLVLIAVWDNAVPDVKILVKPLVIKVVKAIVKLNALVIVITHVSIYVLHVMALVRLLVLIIAIIIVQDALDVIFSVLMDALLHVKVTVVQIAKPNVQLVQPQEIKLLKLSY